MLLSRILNRMVRSMARKASQVEIDAGHWNNLFCKEFKKESPRAGVILSAAMLDLALETLLKTRLVPVGSSNDELLDGAHTPLSDFSARIDLAHRIGLISAKFCRDLHLIRRIRNEFAHNITGCSFHDSNVRNRVMELVRSSGLIEDMPDVRKQFPQGPRGDFQMTISWMLWHLRSQVDEVTSIASPKPEWGYVSVGETRKVSDKSRKRKSTS